MSVSDPVTDELAPSLTHSQFLRVALSVLSLRAAKWLTLVMAFSLYAHASWYPDWRRLAGASAFTALVLLPIWFRQEARHA